MKKRVISILLFTLALTLIIVGSAMAQGAISLPEAIEVFWVDGHTIVRDSEFGTMIYWCTGECGDGKICPTPTITPPPPPTDTPPPPTPPTDTPTPPPPTDTPPPPTDTPEPVCRIWVCHKPDTPAEQDYCCWDSEGCKAAHLAHGDYEGKCR